MRIKLFFLLAVSVLCFTTTAQAVNWPTLPPACLPDRVGDKTKSAAFQANCSCPPANLCPANYNEYKNTGAYKMPRQFVNQCCPSFPPPVCAAGTYYAGQPIPADGKCDPDNCASANPPPSCSHDDPPKCPSGTVLAGKLLPSDKECNRCPIGTDLAGLVTNNGSCECTGASQNLSAKCNICPDGTALARQPVPSNGDCGIPVKGGCPASVLYMNYDPLQIGLGTNTGGPRGVLDYCQSAGYVFKSSLWIASAASGVGPSPLVFPTTGSVCTSEITTGGEKGNHDGVKYTIYTNSNRTPELNTCPTNTGNGNCPETPYAAVPWNNTSPVQTRDIFVNNTCSGGKVPSLTNGKSWANESIIIGGTNYGAKPNWFTYTTDDKVSATCNNGVVKVTHTCTIRAGLPTF